MFELLIDKKVINQIAFNLTKIYVQRLTLTFQIKESFALLTFQIKESE